MVNSDITKNNERKGLLKIYIKQLTNQRRGDGKQAAGRKMLALACKA